MFSLAAEEDLNSEELTLALETQPMQELTSNMVLRWSDDDDDDDEKEDGPAKVMPRNYKRLYITSTVI